MPAGGALEREHGQGPETGDRRPLFFSGHAGVGRGIRLRVDNANGDDPVHSSRYFAAYSFYFGGFFRKPARAAEV
ncbi:hypothetical protein JCM30394_35640 [Deferrisoma palaeochoriense]